MSIRIPTFLATLFLGLVTLLLQPTQAAAGGCEVRNVISTYNGYSFARGLIVQEDDNTGKRVGAYKAITVSDPGACTQACEGDANCTAVTFSGLKNRRCMHFSGYDFETRRPLRLKIYNGGGTGRSTVVRAYYHGPLCNN